MSTHVKLETAKNPVELLTQEKALTETLEHFQVYRNPYLRTISQLYPFIVVLVLIIDYKTISLIVSKPILVMSYLIVASTYLVYMFVCANSRAISASLGTLRERRTICDSTGGIVEPSKYSAFTNEFERKLNSWWGLFLGIIAFFMTYNFFPYADLKSAWEGLFTNLFQPTAWSFLLHVTLSSLTVLLFGPLVWRICIISYMLVQMMRKFQVAVQPAHTDGSGGLLPLGEMCFRNGLVFLLPSVYAAIFSIYVTFVDARQSPSDQNAQVITELFVIDWVIFLLLAIGAFFLPLYEIHKKMLRQRLGHQKRLDGLARRIDELNRQLLTATNYKDTAQVQKDLDALKQAQAIYQSNTPFPIWPLNRNFGIRLVLSQVIGLFTLTKPVFDFVMKLLGR